MSQPPGSPTSQLFSVQETPFSGRGVFATQDIAGGTSILDPENVSISVILREYQKEVCAWCFAYNDGREWKIRDKSIGNVYCSRECQGAWDTDEIYTSKAVGSAAVVSDAWRVVERLIKGTPREDEPVPDADAPRPKIPEINLAWSKAEAQAAHIRANRRGKNNKKDKANSKAAHAAMTTRPDSESLRFLLSGILFRASKRSAWPSIQALAPNWRPYRSTAQLNAHISSYLQLLAILPDILLEHVTAEVCREIPVRDDHNSFGIRSLGDDGSEFLGYGIWIAASYFNHSCEPNVLKRRVGRKWEFTTARDIRAGEELCITYLSGDERAMNTNQRRARLRMNWDFECACQKCAGDDVEMDD